MVEQLLLAKKLFLIGSNYADRDDPVSAGLAISLFQDAVEIFIWSLLKHLDSQAKENAPFTSYFSLIETAKRNIEKKSLPFKAKMLELNKSRVNFKHYGNLPDCSEARKFRAYTEEFLILSCSEFYSTEFDSISIVDLVSFPDVRSQLKAAESMHEKSDFKRAIAETAIAKSILFSKLAQFFPEVDRSLSDVDRRFGAIPELQDTRVFAYISDYLSKSREISIVAMIGIPMHDYVLIQRYSPTVTQMMSGEWNIQYLTTLEPNESISSKAIQMIANTSMRVQEIIGNA